MPDKQLVLTVIRAARPSFRNAHDKIAFAVHATFLASGYVLVATGPPAFSDNALSSSCSIDEAGIDRWNEFEEKYAFLYFHPEKCSKVLVKCLPMNDKLLVDSLSDDGSEPVHLEINVDDYDSVNGGANYGLQYKNLEKLVSTVDKEILSKLNGTSRESLSTQPLSSGPRDVEVDELQSPQVYPAGFANPPLYPVGDSDLYPGAGAGMFPTRGDFGIGGGMFVGPDHPLFCGMGRGRDSGLPGGLPGVPLGARFDPYGQPGVPGFEPSRFIRDPRRPGGGTHPDLEHFQDGSGFI